MLRYQLNWRIALPQKHSSTQSGNRYLSSTSSWRWLIIGILISSAGCSGRAWQNNLSPDPKLKQPIEIGSPAPQTTESGANSLPTDLPIYPQAKLESTTQPDGQGTITTWTTADSIDRVYAFYQQELPSKQWEIVSQPSDSNSQLTAKKENTNIAISAVADRPSDSQPNSTPVPTGVTSYTIALQSTGINPTPTPTPTESTPAAGDRTPTPTASPAASPKANAKLPTAPSEYLSDLGKIGVLGNAETNSAGNRTITRREFARWLVAAYNKINSTKPSHQIKLATTDAKPAFQDVPATNPDFPSIQGLAEAGIIPSPLSGDATTVLFRPDAPLTREQMILWKVPLDTRQALPSASLDALKQTWGFQDVGKIDPKAMRAVLADFQNGEQSNIRRTFGYTTLFQPKKTVNLAEAATAIWYFGANSEGLSARDVR